MVFILALSTVQRTAPSLLLLSVRSLHTSFPILVFGIHLTTLATPQPDSLAVLLQLGDELIALLDHIHILLVLVVGSVGLDDALDAVDGAGNAVCGDELGEVPGNDISACTCVIADVIA